MKKFLAFTMLAVGLCSATLSQAQSDKSKRPSPPATAKQTLKSGATVTIEYSQPALKGRAIGKDVEPMQGKVWRAGANEATVFETDKDIKVEGKNLPAGKYALFITTTDKQPTIIFNKVWKTWGAYDYEKNKEQDALQVSGKQSKADTATEKLTYSIDASGKVLLAWGDMNISFNVK